MRISLLVMILVWAGLAFAGPGRGRAEEDTIPAGPGDLKISFLGHATLMMEYSGKTIHVDPVSDEADYATLPRADLVLITHEHGDHLDEGAVERVRKAGTRIVVSRSCDGRIAGAEVMANGDTASILGLSVEAVPAYNIVHKRPDGNPFHPKGRGNGYLIALGNLKVYIAGDTELVPEMKSIKGVDVAFLPVNLPYTMDVDMAAEAVRTIRPRIFYPYHYGNTDIARLARTLQGEPGIEVRIRKMS